MFENRYKEIRTLKNKARDVMKSDRFRSSLTLKRFKNVLVIDNN
jgi:hypothetical protein